MSIALTTPGLHHVALRTSDFAAAREFYVTTLGFTPEIDAPGFLMFRVGGTAVRIQGPSDKTPAGDVFTPHRTGLDHIALSCGDVAELHRVANALAAAGVENTGVKDDVWFKTQYVAFKAPDRTAWEFYGP